MSDSEELKNLLLACSDLTIVLTLRSSQVDHSRLLKLQQVITTSVTSHVTGEMALIEQEAKTKINSNGQLFSLWSIIELQ